MLKDFRIVPHAVRVIMDTSVFQTVRSGIIIERLKEFKGIVWY
jgi:hypothetical protein